MKTSKPTHRLRTAIRRPVLAAIGKLAIACALLSACTQADDLQPENNPVPLTFTVAPPPAFTLAPGHATAEDNHAGTRSTVDKATGKIAWEVGDKVYMYIGFQDENWSIISEHKVILTRGANGWTPDRSLFWPEGTAHAIIKANHIGTAKPREWINNQPVYQQGNAINTGMPVEIKFNGIINTYLAISGLHPDDKVETTGGRWYGIMLAYSYYGSVNSYMPFVNLTADADGCINIMPYIQAGSDPLTITVTRNGKVIATDLDLGLPGIDKDGKDIFYHGHIIPIHLALPGDVDPGGGM